MDKIGKKIIDSVEYWEIDGNYWNVKLYTQEESKNLSVSLICCSGCIDCKYCKGCIDCKFCNCCNYCKGCNYCNDCIAVAYSGVCNNCKCCECCEKCNGCNYCIYCSYCNFCILCENVHCVSGGVNGKSM